MSSSTEAAERPFEPVRFAARGGDSGTGRARLASAPWGELAADTVEQGDGREPPPATGCREPAEDAAAEASAILFDEDELARVCAGVAWQARSAEREVARRREAEARTAALAAFEARLEALAASDDRAWAALERQLAEVVYRLAAAAVPALVARLERQEVLMAVTDLLARLGPEEELQIRVHPGLAEDLSRRLAASSGTAGGAIRWQVVAEEGMAPGDFRIERRHGFVERRAEDICSQILAAVEAVLTVPAAGDDGAAATTEAVHSAREQQT